MKNSLQRFLFLFIVFLFLSLFIKAQFRNYDLVYSSNAKGSIAMFGNTLMNIVDTNSVNLVKMNDNSVDGNSIYGNDGENMQYADVDGNTGSGTLTRNSSNATLTFPSGTNTIKLARLYWGGRVKTSEFDLTQIANQKIRIRKGFAFYAEFTAAQIDKNIFIQDTDEYVRYQAYTDVTSFIQSNGSGIYTVGNAALSTGAIDNGGNYGGWCIVVVYENSLLNYNSIRLYDGFEQVFDNGNPLNTTVTLTGLNVPPGTLNSNDAKLGVMVWEGDANLVGDYLKINGNIFSDGINPSNNPWNGTISENGLHVTNKTPNYTNQMGIDIDQFYVGTGYGFVPNASTATLEFGTTADQYFPGVITFVAKSVEPSLPVTLIYFNAILQNKNVKITWSTAMEINCNYFNVERSFDGNTFTNVATLQGNGTSSLQHNYSVNDNISSIAASIIYYRLKQFDFDGKFNYSKVIAVRLDEEEKPLIISPNPFTFYTNINIDWNKNESAVINILNTASKKIFSKNVQLVKGLNYIKLEGLQMLSSSTYTVELISATKKISGKIIKH